MSLLQRQSSCKAASCSSNARTSVPRLAGRCLHARAAAMRAAVGQHEAAATAFTGRRELLTSAVAAALALECRRIALPPAVLAEEDAAVGTAEAPSVDDAAAPAPETVPSLSTASEAMAAAPPRRRQVYLDAKIEGKPAGRIVVELFDDVPVGAQRFADIAVGSQGVGYRLNRFDYVVDDFARVEGVKSLSYSADGRSLVAGGDSVQALEEEMAQQKHSHDQPGLVSLVVKEASERPVTERLIARNGKLVTVQTQAGEAPNGTAFAITRRPAPELDATNLVIGRVVSGMDVIERVGALPVNKPPEGWYNKPYFELGKAIGDKRATVAEKGFNRPLKRAIISTAGVL